MLSTGIVRDESFLSHMTGEYHPESHLRLAAIYKMLDEPEMKGGFTLIPARNAAREELLSVHSQAYIDTVAATKNREVTYFDADTVASSGSYRAALRAAGGVCNAVKAVKAEELSNAFALVRPPGHHAESSKAKGFCFFNNVAVAAKFAQAELSLDKILIIDWDLHHGNGTQHTFQYDSSVLYVSIHQYPYYPMTGGTKECGFEDGMGYTVNIPLSAGQGDGEYMAIFKEIVVPVAKGFQPDLILVSAGFDTHEDDPLGAMHVTTAGYASMTQMLLDTALETCDGRLVLTLEGGYDLRSLRNSVKAVLNVLSGHASGEEYTRRFTDPGGAADIIRKVQQTHKGRWGF